MPNSIRKSLERSSVQFNSPLGSLLIHMYLYVRIMSKHSVDACGVKNNEIQFKKIYCAWIWSKFILLVSTLSLKVLSLDVVMKQI